MLPFVLLRYLLKNTQELFRVILVSIAIYQSDLLPRHTFIFIQLKFFGTSIRKNISFLRKTMQQTEL